MQRTVRASTKRPTWGTRIFELAAERGWSDVQLAAHLGVNRITVWRWRNGQVDGAPSTRLMWAAKTVFGREPSALFWPLPPEEEAS